MYKIFTVHSRPAPLIPMEWPSWKLKASALSLFTIEAVVLAVHPTIFQDLSYHNFADDRTFFQISNFWNLVSNLPFFIIGVYALFKGFVKKDLALIKEITPAYIVCFAGVSLVAFGSAYYHFNPGNYTLVWDRLPMTVTFMALLSISFAEFMSAKISRMIMWPLLLLGVFSVCYWYNGELHGHGDLRLYAFVQMTPVLMIPMFLVTGKRKFDNSRGYWTLLAFYVLSKIAERFDDQIFELTFHIIGGHAIKHMLIAIGLFFMIRGYEIRKRICATIS